MDVCTIIAKNYLGFARVLGLSLAEHHPDCRFVVLVIDDLDGHIDAGREPFDIVAPGALDLPDFEAMAARYDVLELSTALKPWLLRWMLERSRDGAVYLDPDMRIYAPLDEMFAAVAKHGLVLSPHNVDPMPRDGRHPDEQDILSAGSYNLGFIGLGPGSDTDELLDWWLERLEHDCVIDPARGFFVDQRWMDLVPGLAPGLHLLRDRGFNVAYWNLATRPISRASDGRWLAAGSPLLLFHFSGFDPERPDVLSKYQDRIRLPEHADLAALCTAYAEEVLAAGVLAARAWPYAYGSTASGMPLERHIRSALRSAVEDAGCDASPFRADTEPAYLAAAHVPAAPEHGGEVGVTRFMAALHAEQEHLRRAFPFLAGVDGPRYITWMQRDSGDYVPPELHPHAEGESFVSKAPEAGPARPFGVNLAGDRLAAALAGLDAAGVPVHLAAAGDRREGAYPVNVLRIDPNRLAPFARDAGDAFFDGRLTIGWWEWPIEQLPEHWLGSVELVDEIWVSSRFAAEALRPVASVPVRVMPPAVPAVGGRVHALERLELPKGFRILAAADLTGEGLARSNPLGAIDAFLRAFPEPGEASLVIRAAPVAGNREARARLTAAVAGHRHLLLVEEPLQDVEESGLIAGCDACISLHRSVSFDITLATAMALDRPAIATGWSGNLEYMTDANSWLVRCQLSGVGAGVGSYPADARWAEPDLDHAAALLREVYDDREASLRRGALGGADVRRRHAPAEAGAHIRRRLDEIADWLPAPRADGWEMPVAARLAGAARERVRAGSQPSAVREQSMARQLLRRATLRLMLPYTEHERQVDEQVLDALGAAVVETRHLTRSTAELGSAALREVRELERRLRGLVELELAVDRGRIETLERQVTELRAELRAVRPER